MSEVVTMILAGGQGTRLFPLTQLRSKPAVPIAGKFRLIDIPISNSLHSNYKQIFVCTQFSAESLHRHIFRTYRLDAFGKNFITILSAQQTLDNRDWYQGTADAVRQNLQFIRAFGDYVLILSGDHLYRMDYSKFVNFHIENKADISISVVPVTEEDAGRFGIMQVDQQSKITAYHEKPESPVVLQELRIDQKILKKHGIAADSRSHLASMGIYVFNKEVLFELLHGTKSSDFGKEVIPYAISQCNVMAYYFDGYWEDIGTIRAFFDAQIELTQPLPRFDFHDEERPIYTHPRFLPGAKVLRANMENVILCDGSIVDPSEIRDAIIGLRAIVGGGSNLQRVVMMGADYFETPEQKAENKTLGRPNVGLGTNCTVRNAIIDKNARIGNSVKIVNEKNLRESEGPGHMIRDGIVIIPKDTVLPDGTVI